MRYSGRIGDAPPGLVAKMGDGGAPRPHSLVPFMSQPEDGDRWQGVDIFRDYGEFHACYFIWGGRAFLQGTLSWEGFFPGFNQQADASIVSTPLPAEIRPATTQTVRLWEDRVNVPGALAADAIHYWDAEVTPDGGWNIVPQGGAYPPVGSDQVLDGVNWPISTITNPRSDVLDLAPMLQDAVAGPDGARLVKGGGRIRGEGSIVTVDPDGVIVLGLPDEWRPHRMRDDDDGNPLLHKGDEIERKAILLGGSRGFWLSHANISDFGGGYTGNWILDTRGVGDVPSPGTEFSLEQVSWLASGAEFSTGSVRGGQPARGVGGDDEYVGRSIQPQTQTPVV